MNQSLFCMLLFYVLLQDRITGLERTLLVAQAENSRLSSKLHTALADVRNALEKEHLENAAKLELENKELKERMLKLESDKLTLQQVIVVLFLKICSCIAISS